MYMVVVIIVTTPVSLRENTKLLAVHSLVPLLHLVRLEPV